MPSTTPTTPVTAMATPPVPTTVFGKLFLAIKDLARKALMEEVFKYIMQSMMKAPQATEETADTIEESSEKGSKKAMGEGTNTFTITGKNTSTRTEFFEVLHKLGQGKRFRPSKRN